MSSPRRASISAAAPDINYPYIFPGKEIEDKLPTITIGSGGFNEIDGGPYPAFSRGPIDTVSNTTTWVKGRHTFKGGVIVEYSGEDDFDQINVNAIPGGTNNQNGRFEFQDTRAAAVRAWRSPTWRSVSSTTTPRLESVR